MTLSGDFDFIQAKTHGLRSKLYELGRLGELCDHRTVAQLWHRLYPGEPAGDHHQLQRRLLADHVATLDLVRQHLPERFTALPTWLLRRFQLENLKVILRARKAGEAFARVEPFLAALPGDLKMPAKALLGASSFADFLLVLPVPEFRAAAQRQAANHVETGETFFVELAMEAAYYDGLLARHKRLPRIHRLGTEPIVSFEAAMHNILCLFRAKLNYEIPYDQAKGFFVSLEPHPFRLERLYDYPAFDDMLELVPRRLLPRGPLGDVRTIADLERALWQRLLQVANRQFYRSVGDLGCVVGFYTIKRVELANLIRVIEGVRYGMGPEAIRTGLIRVEQLAAK